MIKLFVFFLLAILGTSNETCSTWLDFKSEVFYYTSLYFMFFTD